MSDWGRDAGKGFAGFHDYGSLTICEDGQLRPTMNEFGGVVDRFGVYRAPEDERPLREKEPPPPPRWSE